MSTTIPRALRTASLQHPRRIHSQFHVQPNTSLQTLKLSQQSLLRYASTSTTSSTSTSSTTTTTTTTTSPPPPEKPRHPINGPLSTLPAPLDVPSQLPSEKLFPTYALRVGKAYLSFYKTGVKNIYTNFLLARPLQDKIDKAHSFSLPAAVRAGSLTRQQFQLLTRDWHDIKRVPIFGLLFIICGEFTPLVVVALSSVVPWTCRIPTQIAADRAKLEKRRGVSFRNLVDKLPEEKGIQTLSRPQLLHISWSLGLSSSMWDYLGGQYPGLPDFILRRKVRRTIEYIEMDDSLILAAGGAKDTKVPNDLIKEMDTEEVRMALVERGVDIQGRDEKILREHLMAWLKSRESAPVERLLLTR